MNTLLSFVLAFGFAQVISCGTVLPKVMFITEQNVQSKDHGVNWFILRLCGGCLYNNKIATVYLNTPRDEWDYGIGSYLEVTVFPLWGDSFFTNKKRNEDYLQEFSFTYKENYGDLLIKVVTPAITGGITYTVNVNFEASNKSSLTSVRHTPTQKEIEDMNKLCTEKGCNNTQFLEGVFTTSNVMKVKTQRAIQFELNYCFRQGELPGEIQLSTFANDLESGFGTYVCPDSKLDNNGQCQPSETPFRDTSGASVNFVTADVTKNDLGPVLVKIVGDGRVGEMNHFRFAASKLLYSK